MPQRLDVTSRKEFSLEMLYDPEVNMRKEEDLSAFMAAAFVACLALYLLKSPGHWLHLAGKILARKLRSPPTALR